MEKYYARLIFSLIVFFLKICCSFLIRMLEEKGCIRRSCKKIISKVFETKALNS